MYKIFYSYPAYRVILSCAIFVFYTSKILLCQTCLCFCSRILKKISTDDWSEILSSEIKGGKYFPVYSTCICAFVESNVLSFVSFLASSQAL